jgi:hypothetical protein
MAKFQKPGGSLNPTPTPAPPPVAAPAPQPKSYSQPRPPAPKKHTKVTPIPAPPTSGTSGGLNLVELQRRIAEAKSRLNGTPLPTVSLMSFISIFTDVYCIGPFNFAGRSCAYNRD